MDRASLWPTGAKDRSGLGELRTFNFYTVALRVCERVLDDGSAGEMKICTQTKGSREIFWSAWQSVWCRCSDAVAESGAD